MSMARRWSGTSNFPGSPKMRAAQRGSLEKQQLHLRSAFVLPIRSIMPLANSWSIPSTSKTRYLTDEEPLLITNIFMYYFPACRTTAPPSVIVQR